MSETLSITLPEGAQPGEYIIRQGIAEPIHVPGQLHLSGNFGAPAEYIMKRKEHVLSQKLDTHVLFNEKDLSIRLVVGEQDRDTITVLGQLKKHPFLEQLRINAGSPFSNKALLEIIRFKGHYFADKEAFKNLVFNLMKWETSVSQNNADINDRQGKQAKATEINAKTPITGNSYTVSVPFFDGHEPFPVTFRIETEANNGQVMIFLVSETFDEYWEKAVQDKFAEQRPTFEDFVIINK